MAGGAHRSKYVAFVAALVFACGPRRAVSVSQPSGARAARSAESEPNTLAAPCFRRGPLACDAPPSPTSVRAAIDACWPDPALGFQAHSSRQLPARSVAEIAAPAELGSLRRASVVQAPLASNEDAQFQGFYLLAEYPEGYCLVDELVSPGQANLSHCKHTFGLSWQTRRDPPVLEVSHAALCSAERAPERESKGTATYGIDHERFDLLWDQPREPGSAASPSSSSFSCYRRGPWSCEQSPSGDDAASLCRHISACARNRYTSLGVILAVTDCEPLTSVAPGPAGSGVAALGLVSASARFEPEDKTYFHAAYLLAKYADQGWCLIDQVFEPLRVPLSCDATAEMRFAPEAEGKGFGLELRAQFVGREAVDQDEVGVYSGVFAESCQDSQYSLRDGALRKQRVSERDGRCDGTSFQNAPVEGLRSD